MITPEALAKIGTELAHQQALFCWAALLKGDYPELEYLFHIPNGGVRHIVEGTKLKSAGVKAGVPDIMLPVKRGNYCGLWIELKNEKGKVTVEQSKWIDFLTRQHYKAIVCFGWQDARDRIIEYLDGKV